MNKVNSGGQRELIYKQTSKSVSVHKEKNRML